MLRLSSAVTWAYRLHVHLHPCTLSHWYKCCANNHLMHNMIQHVTGQCGTAGALCQTKLSQLAISVAWCLVVARGHLLGGGAALSVRALREALCLCLGLCLCQLCTTSLHSKTFVGRKLQCCLYCLMVNSKQLLQCFQLLFFQGTLSRLGTCEAKQSTKCWRQSQ